MGVGAADVITGGGCWVSERGSEKECYEKDFEHCCCCCWDLSVC